MWEVNDINLQKLIVKNKVILTKKQRAYLNVKRALDFLCSSAALILLSPLLLLIAIAIKIDSPNESVIFKQVRVGQYGKPFMLYKFRSMKQGTPELGTSEFANAEQYITKIGKILRKTSLDELPQLWCVICGHMSLVGPRPLLKREEEVHYLRNYYGIYQLKPGITGLAQISGRDEVTDYEKVGYDREYIRKFSFVEDVSIIWRTIVKVLKREGVVEGMEKQKLSLTR